MTIVFGILKWIAACAPFAGVLLLLSKVNLKKSNRGRQFALPLVALVYAMVLAVLLVKLGNDPFRLEYWIGLLVEKIPALSGVAETILNFIRKYITLLTNLASVLVFLVLKAICLPIFGGIWSRQSVMQSTSALFYGYDEQYHRWLLEEHWKDFRKLIHAFYLAVAVSAVALLALSQQFTYWKMFQASPYPCFAALVMGELYFFLGGYTRTEFEEDIMGEDAQSQRVTNLSKLRELLKQLFDDRLLLESTQLESAGKEGVTDLLEELSLEESPTARITAEYFQILKEDGVQLDVDSILSAQALLEGNSVLFCNPFYQDLTQYFLLPMSDTLMHRRKCLVIAGRKSTEPEIRSWMERALAEHLKMSGLWRVGSVESPDEDYEIGILSFSQLYDLNMIRARQEFFRQVGFVLVLEPSLILATGQVGLSLVFGYCDEGDRKSVYCMCDRNCDGLVDTLSHMIKQSITTVSATETPTCLHSEMSWHSDGDYLHQRIMPDISRYLGVGTELAVASVKDQAPRVVWRSERKFPVVDMKWIVGQYYQSICQYANLPMNQESVYRTIGFEADLWGTPKEKTNCIIVEDEFCNLLEMVRLFITRAENEAFVNVISEDYLLRGYMQDNYSIFAADRKAIPTIVPDYARTERNATMRLLMMLVMGEAIPEETVEKELRLVGIKTENVCDTLNELIRKYTVETDAVVSQISRDAVTGYDLDGGTEILLYIKHIDSFLDHAGLSFRTAYYITEDDKENSSYMDAKLFGHIFQSILPGQFFTYDGKYYEVRSVTPEKGVLVRRAADHIVGRRYYRQKRSYHLLRPDEETGRSRYVNGLEVTTCGYELSVETDGYLELDESNDLRRAREVRIADNEAQSNEHFEYVRNYQHKNVLRIRLPEASEEVRYTICLLLMEVFRTVYAEDWHYLAAVTAQTERTQDALRGVLYRLDGAGDVRKGTNLVEEDCIYIIEDSDVDMGLLESVDRNLSRLMGIITDFLDWHSERMVTPDPPEPQVNEVELPPAEKRGILWHIKQFFRKIGNFFRRLFHLKPVDDAEKAKKRAERQAEKERRKAEKKAQKGKPTDDTPTPEEPIPEEEPTPVDGEPTPDPVDAEPVNTMEDTPNRLDDDAHGATPNDPNGPGDLEERAQQPQEEEAPAPVVNRYQRSCYLRYGYDGIDSAIAVEDTLSLLDQLGFGDSELSRVRKGEGKRAVDVDPVALCDFCALPLSGVAYDVLGDGRIRCVSCTSSAIQTVAEFRALYQRVLPTMETFFNIRMDMPVRVRTADARVIAKQRHAVYKPTAGFDARVVGFARIDKDGFTLYVENGAPRLSCMETTVHELTHIWQYRNWDLKQVKRTYQSNQDLVFEGMAMWASIQFLYLIGETAQARRKEENTLLRDDIYGEGFRYFCQRYPLSRGTELPKYTPFHTWPPL